MKLIGRIENIDLPEFGFNALEAKIDSGAYTSSLHCHNIKSKKIDGKRFVSFKLLDPKHPNYEDKEILAEINAIRRVKSSNGFMQKRFAIKTKIKLGKKRYIIEFTLTDRRDMRYPILLGSKFIKNKFIIDVSKKKLLSKNENSSTINQP